MSEGELLFMVERYPELRALARRVPQEVLFEGIRRLESHGLIRRRDGQLRLTNSGAREYALQRVIACLVFHGRFT